MTMEDTPTYEKQNVTLSETERKEKLLLDFFLLQHEIETKVENKKILKELKKSTLELTIELQNILNIEISKKSISDYITLKNSSFDKELLRLAKYLQ